MQPQEWTVNGLSVELRRDRRTVNQIIVDCGVEPVRDKGRSKYYRMADIINAMLNSGHFDLEQERAKLAKAQRHKVELQNRQTEGELVEVAVVREAISKQNSILRNRLLAIPNRLAPRIYGAQSVPVVAQILKDAVNGALRQICEDLSNIGERDEGTGRSGER